MQLFKKSLVAALHLTFDLYVLIVIFDTFVYAGDVLLPIWERTPPALLIWWPALLSERLFNESTNTGTVALLLTNVIVYTLLLYPFFRWRAGKARLH